MTNEPETNVCRGSISINGIVTLSRGPKNDFREAKIGHTVFECFTFNTAEVINTSDRVVLIQNVSVDVRTVVTTHEAFLISDRVAETGAVLFSWIKIDNRFNAESQTIESSGINEQTVAVILDVTIILGANARNTVEVVSKEANVDLGCGIVSNCKFTPCSQVSIAWQWLAAVQVNFGEVHLVSEF